MRRNEAITTNHPLELLERLGEIGSEKATASLSALAGRLIDSSYTHVRIVRLEEIPNLFGDPEEIIAGVVFQVKGDILGTFVVCFMLADALMLAKALTGINELAVTEFGEMEMSAIAEAGNILTSSYLAALETLTGLVVVPSPPAAAVDMAGGVLTSAVLPLHEAGSEILFIEARFGTGKMELEGRMILLPRIASLPILLRAIEAQR